MYYYRLKNSNQKNVTGFISTLFKNVILYTKIATYKKF